MVPGSSPPMPAAASLPELAEESAGIPFGLTFPVAGSCLAPKARNC